jgi:hypothetical protein
VYFTIEVMDGMRVQRAVGHHETKRHAVQQWLPYTVFLYIWGAQWVLSSCISFIGQWQDVDDWRQAAFWLALAASTAAVATGYCSGGMRLLSGLTGKALLPFLLIIAAVTMLQHVQAIDPFFVPLLKSFVLAIVYAQLGLTLGRPLIYMSLWLFALTSVVAVWYLGFASLLLVGFGGLSMIVLAWMIGIWNKHSYKSEEGEPIHEKKL